MKSRQLKKELLNVLSQEKWQENISSFLAISPSQLINPLISLLYHPVSIIKWRAVSMIGLSVKPFAMKEKELARVIIRRFMWYLNEESGGIGWGIPEAFGEILSNYQWMAQEYASILVYYIIPGGSFLDMQELQTSVIWGIGRGAQGHASFFQFACPHLIPFLTSETPSQRGTALWAMKQLKCCLSESIFNLLKTDTAIFELYDQGKLLYPSIAEIANTFET